jgi:hypothetical protein
MSGDITTDLPYDVSSGDVSFDLDEPLSRLQTMLNMKNIDIESLDMRGEGQDAMFKGFEPRELQKITGFVNNNPEMDIKSAQVRDLNDKFDKNLDNSNPNYIFRDDLRTRNNVNIIKMGNMAFARERDMFVTPPPKDIQQKIFEMLK